MKKEDKKIDKAEKDVKDIKDIEELARDASHNDAGEEIVVEQENLSAVEEDEIQILEKKAAENLDGWQRCQADFENYKKRSAESQKDLVRYAAQNIILQILPVIDNFHASTAHVPVEQKDNSWVIGIMYIQKQLEDIVTENGVEEIEARVGDNFDPIYHEAIEDKQCADCKVDHKYKNKIKQVLTKGYKIGDKVIRAARVVVE